jgi:hypothetical protein
MHMPAGCMQSRFHSRPSLIWRLELRTQAGPSSTNANEQIQTNDNVGDDATTGALPF